MIGGVVNAAYEVVVSLSRLSTPRLVLERVCCWLRLVLDFEIDLVQFKEDTMRLYTTSTYENPLSWQQFPTLSYNLSIISCIITHHVEQSASDLLAPPIRRHPDGTRSPAETIHTGRIRTTPSGKDHHGTPSPGSPQEALPLRHCRLPSAAVRSLDLPTMEPSKGPQPGRQRSRPRAGRDPEGRGLA